MKRLSLNEKIYKVLTTKVGKTNEYITELKEIGLIVYDNKWSSYNYYAIKNPETGRSITISKDHENVKKLYDEATPINNAIKDNIKNVDFISLLNCKRKCNINKWLKDRYGYNNRYRDVKTSKARELVNVKRDIRYKKEYLEEIEKELEKILRKKERYIEELDRLNNKKQEILKK